MKTDFDPWYTARERMVESVIADLHGSADDELLTEEPLERYIVGILHPRAADGTQAQIEAANEMPEDEAGAAPDADYDPGVSFANLRYPSTIGLTFGLTEATRGITVEVEADRYEPEDSADLDDGTEEEPEVADRGHSKRSHRWHRIPFGPRNVDLDVVPGATSTVKLTDGLELRVVVRPARDEVVNATLVLVNTFTKPYKGRADMWCWFRPALRVHALDGEFADRRPNRVLTHMDADERSGELLYRSQRHLAVGHGVAVTWDEGSKVTTVGTTFFPEHDLHLAQAERNDVTGLGMKTLAEPGVYEPLDRLVNTYETWIEEQSERVPELFPESSEAEEQHARTAEQHVEEARQAAVRMRHGIDLLTRDPNADRAFRVMNIVMQQQRVRQEMIRKGAKTPPDIEGEWRPFQIAFILLNLEGLVDLASEDRDVADLLWFPTGGGKTEAYLGLIAFTLVHRRLRGAGEDGAGAGVGVLMRYTLRLLTLQQFERASGLICALEDWRRSAQDMVGKEPFSIGLWVGQGATPNNAKDAATALKKRLNDEDPGDGGDPVQLLRCPWCGTRLGTRNYNADVHKDEVTVQCADAQCPFRTGLPVHLVDSDVYRARPSLVIGTVDKFAMLAWRAKSGQLFGSGYDAPPDLIVQDELHLISGPLGTLVGLYETAIDHLATDTASGARPKLVASTATIRRAGEQVHAVFARNARQFPPPGVDAGDSFFAVDAPPAVKGTRRYVGLMAPSTSHATLLVRTYAALLQGAEDLDTEPEVRDAYWTLLGYFNSLRVLGAAYIQSIDDVRDRIKVVAKRLGSGARETRDPRELTSRKKSSEIPLELDALQTAYPDPGSPDIVLATNMISVGVDVDRLGLMAVMGQPQTTSEYIQATSRVGRRYPGLVFTLYNASRSRDLSHYEAFTSYHRALYKQVEATGVTPFAPRALDRGLHGLLIILARHTISGSADDLSVKVPLESGELARIVDVIVTRAEKVEPGTGAEVREALDKLIAAWQNATENGLVLKYQRWALGKNDARGLISPAGASGMDDTTGEPLAEIFPPLDPPWPTLTSLRNVDRESTLQIISTRKTKAVAGDGNQ
ncbi:helicase-related protein [Kocuria sp. CPCC 205263]|uniref:helicase-related protein n=1 Tax=Kocuria sp. CPCC 205263 TaxID=3073555 RepID=UPI0034D4A91D